MGCGLTLTLTRECQSDELPPLSTRSDNRSKGLSHHFVGKRASLLVVCLLLTAGSFLITLFPGLQAGQQHFIPLVYSTALSFGFANLKGSTRLPHKICMRATA